MIRTRPQLTLEEEYLTKLYARKGDPVTSRRAAKRMIKSGKLTKQQKAVLNIIRQYCQDHKDFTPLDLAGGERNNLYFAIQRRKNELELKGFIKKTGEERDNCEVWRLVYRS